MSVSLTVIPYVSGGDGYEEIGVRLIHIYQKSHQTYVYVETQTIVTTQISITIFFVYRNFLPIGSKNSSFTLSKRAA